jgi:hypothetical protein
MQFAVFGTLPPERWQTVISLGGLPFGHDSSQRFTLLASIPRLGVVSNMIFQLTIRCRRLPKSMSNYISLTSASSWQDLHRRLSPILRSQMQGSHAFCGRTPPTLFCICLLHHCAALSVSSIRRCRSGIKSTFLMSLTIFGRRRATLKCAILLCFLLIRTLLC